MTPLPPGRAIAVVPPRAGALTAIAGEVHRRRTRKRRNAFAFATLAVPLALVATTLSRDHTSSLQPVQPPAPAASVPASPASERRGTPVAAGPFASAPVGTADPAASPRATPPYGAPPFHEPSPSPSAAPAIEMDRHFNNNVQPTCYGAAKDGWCVSPIVDESSETGRPYPILAVRVCRYDSADGTLAWPTTHEADFEVSRGDEVVYRWSAGRTFASDPHTQSLSTHALIDSQAPSPISPRRKACLQWRITWPVVDNAGAPLPRDATYTMHAWTVADGMSGAVVAQAFSAAPPD